MTNKEQVREWEKEVLLAKRPSETTKSGFEVVYDPEYLIGFIASLLSSQAEAYLAAISKDIAKYEEIAERADTKVQNAESDEDAKEWEEVVIRNLAKADAISEVRKRWEGLSGKQGKG